MHLTSLAQALVVLQGALLLAAAQSHLRDRESLPKAIRTHGILPGNPQVYATAVMITEVVLPLLIIVTLFSEAARPYTQAVVGVATGYGALLALYLWTLWRREYEGDCGCGMLDRSLPLTRTAILRAALLPAAGTTALISGTWASAGSGREAALATIFGLMIAGATAVLPAGWSIALSLQRALALEHGWQTLSPSSSLSAVKGR